MTVVVLHALQRFLLRVSYRWARLGRRGKPNTISWIVGVDELAGMLSNIAAIVPRSFSVLLSDHRFYSREYNYALRPSSFMRRVVLGPIVLGRVLARADGILYLGSSGFLLRERDERRFEFTFARRHGVKVACYFVGDDIRAPRLLIEMRHATGIENLGDRVVLEHPHFGSDEYDASKRTIAKVADDLADIIFTSPTDQLSYITAPTEPVTYYYPDSEFLADDSKFERMSRPVVVHAPSSPVIKGTALVRAAVESLARDGYDFEYVELIDRTHDEVLHELQRAHIALNQFYAFQTGVFGIEAMAARCAVLMSADPTIESTLMEGAEGAWIVTRYDQIEAHLRAALDDPERVREVAARGHEWARAATFGVAGPRLVALLDSVIDGSYRPGGRTV